MTTKTSETAPAQPHRGRHALVTGGSRGIGAACAHELAAAGAAVTLLGRNAARLESRAVALGGETGSDVGAIVADVTDRAALTDALARAADEKGPVTLLINNAGGTVSAPLERLDFENWNDTINLNLTSAYVAMQAVIPGMREQGFGRIVNVASVAALKGYAYISAYCAAKHGLIGLTRAAAVELAGTSITVNAVCPGYTDTDMSQRTVEHIVETSSLDAKEARAALVANNPQGRMIQPQEVAASVAYLCLPSSASITGVALPIAGGEVA